MARKSSSFFNFKLLKSLLLIGTVLAAVKVVFVDYTMDEEYQIVMAYRLLAGDHLFDAMWEPHQTSAFACALLMGLFRFITGGTAGVVLYLRVCTTAIQAILATWLYRVCRDHTRREYAFMIGLLYFNIVPKIIQIPDFSNLQVWFFTVVVLSLIRYYEKDFPAENALRHRLWLILAGIGMAFEVLSYLSCLLLFPVFLICIFLQSKKGMKKDKTNGDIKRALTDCFIFAGVCGVSAIIWLGYVLYHVPFKTFIRNLGYVLSFDLSHDISLATTSQWVPFESSLQSLMIPFMVVIASSLLLWILLYLVQKRNAPPERKQNLSLLAVLMVLAAEAVQLFYWVVLQRGYEEPMIHLLILLLAAVFVWHLADTRKKTFLPGLIGTFFSIVAVLYISDLGVWHAIPHGMLGSLLAVLVLIYALECEMGERSKRWIWVLLTSLVILSIFGKGFVLRAGKAETNTVLGISGVSREGPTAGIFMYYIQAYIIDSTYEEFEEYVEDGANCLIVTNMMGTAGSTPYLFRDCNVCHFSVIDPTSYDERLLTYWDLYPNKQPDVIIVDCWYGQLMEPENSWIIQYIENEFGYTAVRDGKYLRYYYK